MIQLSVTLLTVMTTRLTLSGFRDVISFGRFSEFKNNSGI
jgi:hypothetical protein